MPTLADHCLQFTQLRRAPNRIFPTPSKKLAPHKPLLLLAIMDMPARNELDSRFISITGELTTLFTGYWRALMPITHTSRIAFPFSRLATEPFWELVPVPGKSITRESINEVPLILRAPRVT